MISRRLEGAGLAAILGLAVVLSLLDGRRDSVTADEPVHVAAGLAQAVHGGWSLNLEHPPLAKELFGRAARLAGARDGPISFRAFFRSCQDVLFRNRGGVAADAVLLPARAVTVGFFAFLIAASYAAAGGGGAGLLAAALVAGEAAFFPHGHLATTDVPFAALGAAAVAALLGHLEKPSASRLLLAALLLALAALTKFTGLLLFPVAAGLVLLGAEAKPAKKPKRVALALGIPLAGLLAAVALLRLWNPPSSAENLSLLTGIYRLSPADQGRIQAIGRVDAGAARYAAGLLVNLRQAEAGRPTYFLGAVTDRPPATYHAVALLVTAPAVWLLFVAAGAASSLRRGAPPRTRSLLLSAVALFVLSLPGPRIGVRHVLLPAVLASAGAAAALAQRRGPRPLLVSVIAALAPLALGRTIGREGLAALLYQRPALADSNLDWGQDLLRLRDELGRRGLSPSGLAVAYFGGDEPSERLPGAADLLRGGSLEGRTLLAVSRQFLLVGPGASLDPAGVPGAAAAVAAVRSGRARFHFRAGTSMDVFSFQTDSDRRPEEGVPLATPPAPRGSQRAAAEGACDEARSGSTYRRMTATSSSVSFARDFISASVLSHAAGLISEGA